MVTVPMAWITALIVVIYIGAKELLPLIRRNGQVTNGTGRYEAGQAALRREEMRTVFIESLEATLQAQVVPLLEQIRDNTKP
jgi:hypothetical protein